MVASSLTPSEVKKLSGPQLVEAYNGITGEQVKRFSNRDTGVKRVLEALKKGVVPAGSGTTPKKAKLKQYRPSTARGKVITLLSRSSGAALAEIAVAADLSIEEIEPFLRSIEIAHGCEIATKTNGNRVLTTPISQRRPINLPSGSGNPPREGTKRAKVLAHIREGKATFESIAALVGRTETRARECLRLLSKVNGIGFRQDDKGIITVA